MSLEGKKIAVLMEADYYEPEIWYYAAPLPRGGRRGALPHAPLGPGAAHLRRPRVEGAVRGRRELRGHGRRDAALVRRGDRARRAWSPTGSATRRTSPKLPPATEFLQRAFAEPSILKGIICHGMWLVAPVPELVRGRPVVVHNNLHGDAVNMGAIYTDEDVVVDGDLVTARTGGHCHLFAHKIIELLGDGRRDDRGDRCTTSASTAPTRSRSSGGTRSTSASSASASTCPAPTRWS